MNLVWVYFRVYFSAYLGEMYYNLNIRKAFPNKKPKPMKDSYMAVKIKAAIIRLY